MVTLSVTDGEIIRASVLEVRGPTVTLGVFGVRIRASSVTPLRAGQELTLRVETDATGRLVRLRRLDSPCESDGVDILV